MFGEETEDMTGYIKQFMQTAPQSQSNNSVAKKLIFNDSFELYGKNNKRKSTTIISSPSDKKVRTSNENDQIDSPWEQRRLRSNLLEAKTQITRLEKNIESQHALRKEMELLFSNEKQSLQRQKINDARTIAELESRLQAIRKRDKESRADLAVANNKYDQLKLEKDTEIQELEERMNELTDELDEIRDEAVFKQRQDNEREDENHLEISGIKFKSTEFEKKISELTEQLTVLRDIEKKYSLVEMEHEIAKIRIKELQNDAEKYGEWQSQAKSAQKKLASMPDLERELERIREEVTHLRDAVHNKLLLEEQVNDLQSRVALAAVRQQELSNLQIAHGQVESQLKAWKEMAKNYCTADSITPRELRVYVENLQQKELVLTDEKLKAQSEQKRTKNELNVTKQELQKFTKDASDVQTSVKQYQKLLHRVQKKLQLVVMERDGFKSLLDAYEKDLTISNPANMTTLEAQLQKRIEGMDHVLNGYKDLIKKFEVDLQAAQPIALTNTPIRVEQLSRLQEENSSLQRDIEQQRKRCDELEKILEYRSMKGDFNPATNKIVHFNQNPLAISQEKYRDEVVQLQADIDRLKKTIRKLQENPTHEMTQNVSMTASQELLLLRDQVKSHESKMQHLKEVFTSSSQEFRDACYMMLGFKIDRLSNNNEIFYRLTNMYAECESDHLNFQITEDGSLNLLENQYSLSIEDFISTHLQHQGSIPVFLSALTIDLFKRTTMMVADDTD